MGSGDAAEGAGIARGRSPRKALYVVQDEGGSGRPFAFVLAGYGDAWVAQGLARALGPGHTLYALQPPRQSSAKPARELAAIYVEQLRAAQPSGPYYLGGYSAGAVMALEIAIQLRAQGETVGLVAALDPLFIRYTPFERRCYLWFQRVCRAVGKLLPGKPRLLQILTAMFEDQGLDTHLECLTGYKPDRYPGEIMFFRARWSMGRSPLLVRQWRWNTGARVKVAAIPGDHHTFIRPPHVAEVARLLREEMAGAASSHSR